MSVEAVTVAVTIDWVLTYYGRTGLARTHQRVRSTTYLFDNRFSSACVRACMHACMHAPRAWVPCVCAMQVDGARLDQMSAAEYTCLAALPSHPNVVALLATVGPAALTPDMERLLPPAIKEISEVCCRRPTMDTDMRAFAHALVRSCSLV